LEKINFCFAFTKQGLTMKSLKESSERLFPKTKNFMHHSLIGLLGLCILCFSACSDSNELKKEVILLKKLTLTTSSGLEVIETYEYDDQNRLTEWTELWNDWPITFYYSYTPNTVTITSTDDDVIVHYYNNAKELIGASIKYSGQGEITVTVENSKGKPVKMIFESPYGTSITEYTYDDKGENVIKEKYDNGSEITFSYAQQLNPHHVSVAANPYNLSRSYDLLLDIFVSKNIRAEHSRTYIFNEKNLPVSSVVTGNVTANFTYEYEFRQ
jgi:YD repeat-containing protein